MVDPTSHGSRTSRAPSCSGDEIPSLHSLVRAHQRLNRTLFWADVELSRQHSSHVNSLTHWAQVHIYSGTQLWAFGEADLDWLKDDTRHRDSSDDRRIALSAILAILNETGRLKSEADDLRKKIGAQPVLLADLDYYLAPPPQRHVDTDHEREMERLRRERAAQTERDKASWMEFADFLRADPGQLRDPAQVRTWKAGAFSKILRYGCKSALTNRTTKHQGIGGSLRKGLGLR